MSIPDRLEVRETDHFAYQVFEYFPLDQSGPNGELSRSDFIRLELNPAKEVIATRFFELPELLPGRPDYRIYSVPGIYVPLFTIEAQLTEARQLIELVNLDVDSDPPETFWVDS